MQTIEVGFRVRRVLSIPVLTLAALALPAAAAPPAKHLIEDAPAKPARQVFEFPADVGRLKLFDASCADGRILKHYGDNVPAPFHTGLLEIRGLVLNGCWYKADGRVFFTDSELDLLVPPPAIEWFTEFADSQ